jgi:hypothetical protein
LSEIKSWDILQKSKKREKIQKDVIFGNVKKYCRHSFFGNEF